MFSEKIKGYVNVDGEQQIPEAYDGVQFPTGYVEAQPKSHPEEPDEYYMDMAGSSDNQHDSQNTSHAASGQSWKHPQLERTPRLSTVGEQMNRCIDPWFSVLNFPQALYSCLGVLFCSMYVYIIYLTLILYYCIKIKNYVLTVPYRA